MDYKKAKADFEKEFILKALQTFQGINNTSEKANIGKRTLLRKCQLYGIDTTPYHAPSGHRIIVSEELCG